jgi:hypothetical protein
MGVLLIKVIKKDGLMALYTSELTQFLQTLQTNQPDLAQAQVAGRALLWDKTQDREFQASIAAAKVPQKAYVYFS